MLRYMENEQKITKSKETRESLVLIIPSLQVKIVFTALFPPMKHVSVSNFDIKTLTFYCDLILRTYIVSFVSVNEDPI